MLTVVEKVIFLQKVDIFGKIGTEQLAYLAAIAREITTPKGGKIYGEGDPSDALYLVLEGSVRLQRDNREIASAAAGEAFGTWALFDEDPRVVTAVAAEDTRLLRIDRDEFVELLADHVQITQGILRTVAGRLRGLVERVGIDPSAGPHAAERE